VTLSSLTATTMDPLSKDLSRLSVGDLHTSTEAISPYTIPTLTRVSSERDVSIDHRVLDAMILKAFSAFRKFNEEPDWPTLLSIITLGDKRLVTLTGDEAEELLTRQPSVTVVLQKAWEEASFKEVRQLGAYGMLRIFSLIL